MVEKRSIGGVTFTSLGIACGERTLSQVCEIFPEIAADELRHAIRAASGTAGSPSGEIYTWCFNAGLIGIGGHHILVDTGFGFSDGGPGTSMRDLLSQAGVEADEIGTVVITHSHGDHVGGLLDGDTPAFGNATLIIHTREYEHAMSTAGSAATALKAYGDSVEVVENGYEIASTPDSKIRVVDAPGHTPGHIAIEIISGGDRLTLLVDTLHTTLQLAHPRWSPRFDADASRAEATRIALLDSAADGEIPVHLYHFPFPGWGTIRRTRTGTYEFIPG